MAGLNVAQVAHAQSKGTCVVGPNSAGNPTSNPVSGNPHCFDPEQQPLGTTSPGGATGTCTTNPCSAAGGGGNHPQSTNPQGTVTANPHEEPSSGCPPAPTTCHQNPQGSLVGDPHYAFR